ncbi:MAG: hypothetical protein ACF8MF_02035 [Phycisphaerales bacterium JB052]
MMYNTRVRLIALACLFAGLVGSGYFGTQITASTGRHGLSYTDTAEENDPPMVAMGIALGAMRGVFVNYLWIRATKKKDEGQYYEAVELADWITRLQPRLPQVWTFHAWNMAYNISVTTQTPQERWGWVNAGVRLLRNRGIRANPNDMHMHKELAWIFLHKIAGFTDDANQYYKRQFAYEWHNVLGRKPVIDPEHRDRESVIEQYVDWIQPIVDAPATLSGLEQANPTAAAIARAYEARLGEDLGTRFLERYTLQLELERAGRLGAIQETAGPRTKLFLTLKQDFNDEQAWTDLVNHVRRRVLEDEYFMEPVRMVQIVRKFGPVDWRLPAAHALYWGARGTDVGRMEVNEHNADSLDFVNAYRLVMQSVQDLWRFGDMYFNYLDVHEQRQAYYQGVPNPYFVPTYGSMLDEVTEASGLFEADRRAYRQFSAGYMNFLRDAVRFFYRRGDTRQAEYWYDKLRNWKGLNINDTTFVDEVALPLKEFADKQLYDSMGSPQVAVSEVYGALQGAYYQGLLAGDIDAFNGMWEYARKAHAYYFSEQYRQVISSTAGARMEFMDRNFPFLAGNIFTNILATLGPEEAEILYSNAPEDLRRYAYDALVTRFKVFLDTQFEQGNIEENFDMIFPEPSGMEQHRVLYQRELDRREQQNIEGVLKN